MGILRQQPHGFRIADHISTFVLPTRLWIASVLPWTRNSRAGTLAPPQSIRSRILLP